jgi:4-aminobutyrate aminotransferase
MAESIYDRFERLVAGNMNLQLYDLAFDRGEQQYLYDLSGKKYLDCFSGASAAILGYDNKEVINSYVETCSRLHHTCSVYTPTDEVIHLAEKLVGLVPSAGFGRKVIFGLSGSDAVECSFKASRKFTGRRPIFCFQRAYHGSCGLSISATGWDSLQKGLTLDEDFYSFPYPINSDLNGDILDLLTRTIKDVLPAAIIIEAIQGDGGMYPANSEFLLEISRLAREHGIVLICDEIQSGMGRTGKWWGFELAGVVPDLVVIGKGISAGYGVLSAVVGRAEVLDSLGKGQHVFTYSASPHACAVCSTVIEIIEENDLVRNNDRLGRLFLDKLQTIDSPLIEEIRGRGLMIGVEINATEDFNAGLVGLRCSEKGVYFGYYGLHNELLRIHPPYIISEDDIDYACNVLSDTLEEIYKNRIPADTYRKYLDVCIGLGN